jgi:hypothetical protein
MEPGGVGDVNLRSNLGAVMKFPSAILKEDIVKKTITALSLAAFAMSFVVPAYAAGTKSVPCKPAKAGYHMVGGKCVPIKKNMRR